MIVAGQQPTGGMDSGRDGEGREETFSSAIIDLTDIDLAEVSQLPSSVLRAAIQRVRAELAADEECTSYFQSSLPDRATARTRPAIRLQADSECPDGNGTRKPG